MSDFQLKWWGCLICKMMSHMLMCRMVLSGFDWSGGKNWCHSVYSLLPGNSLKVTSTNWYKKLPSVFDISNPYTIRYHFFHQHKGKRTTLDFSRSWERSLEVRPQRKTSSQVTVRTVYFQCKLFRYIIHRSKPEGVVWNIFYFLAETRWEDLHRSHHLSIHCDATARNQKA